MKYLLIIGGLLYLFFPKLFYRTTRDSKRVVSSFARKAVQRRRSTRSPQPQTAKRSLIKAVREERLRKMKNQIFN